MSLAENGSGVPCSRSDGPPPACGRHPPEATPQFDHSSEQQAKQASAGGDGSQQKQASGKRTRGHQSIHPSISPSLSVSPSTHQAAVMSVEVMAQHQQQQQVAPKARSPKNQADKLKKRKKSVAETCRDTVTKIEQSLWSYRDAAGEEWDAQPACFITDYLLAVQCFAFAVYVALFASNEDQQQPAWYLIYFVALGISAAFGGLLHHVAFEAMRGFKDKKTDSLVQRAKVFGFHFKRSTVDGFIDVLWRIVLGFSILTNFALLSLAASRYLNESWAYTIIIVAGTLYIALAIWASINMHVLFLFVGYLPPMIFGAVTSAMAFDWQWSHPSNELLVYVLKLGSGLVQGLIVSPSKSSFNHNALSHVILSLAATFMLVHFKL